MTLNRLDRARTVLQDQSVDAILITNGTNRRYLSGFTAEDHAPDELSAVAVLARDTAVLFAPSTNLPWAKAEASEGVEVRSSERQWTSAVAELIRESGWASLGIEDATTTVAVYNELKDELGDIVRMTSIGNALDSLRAVKDEEEITLVSKALRMTDRAFVAAEKRIQVGMTEKEAAYIIDEELRNVGSEGESFPTIVASGPNAAKPHHSPGDRVIQEGEPVIIDMGALHQGYAGDLTRTIWFGQPSQQLVTIYQTVAAAHESAMASAAPGVTGVELDRAARDVFEDMNLEHYFVHSLGHGLGLRVHESPSASPRSTDTLEAGHIITIEPGLYIPDWGGVRIEDVALITPDGASNLTGAPKRSV